MIILYILRDVLQEKSKELDESWPKKPKVDNRGDRDRRQHEMIINIRVAFSRWKSLIIRNVCRLMLKCPASCWTGKSNVKDHNRP